MIYFIISADEHLTS